MKKIGQAAQARLDKRYRIAERVAASVANFNAALARLRTALATIGSVDFDEGGRFRGAARVTSALWALETAGSSLKRNARELRERTSFTEEKDSAHLDALLKIAEWAEVASDQISISIGHWDADSPLRIAQECRKSALSSGMWPWCDVLPWFSKANVLDPGVANELISDTAMRLIRLKVRPSA